MSVVTDLLNSDDPEAIIGLVALPYEVEGMPVAEYLLGDITFEALLSIVDKEALARAEAVYA